MNRSTNDVQSIPARQSDGRVDESPDWWSHVSPVAGFSTKKPKSSTLDKQIIGKCQ